MTIMVESSAGDPQTLDTVLRCLESIAGAPMRAKVIIHEPNRTHVRTWAGIVGRARVRRPPSRRRAGRAARPDGRLTEPGAAPTTVHVGAPPRCTSHPRGPRMNRIRRDGHAADAAGPRRRQRRRPQRAGARVCDERVKLSAAA